MVAYASGIRFTGFMNPFTDSYVLLPPWLQFVLTITWIFGVTTVINWSDGIDCLAGGLSALSGFTFFVAALLLGQSDSALMAALVVGAAFGFLKYNYFPAKIYMGDSGANFLGFVLAVISLHGAFKQATVISMFVPVLALGVPIFDNLVVVLRRFLNKRPLSGADASQIHHRLLRSGMKPKQVVKLLMLVSVGLNLASIVLLLIGLQG
jgi:UDP-N-acetylmuramyl pentapeptide phosphotransferase/UDP-N-acetylglucosamine-1-phosphate transferase